TTAGWRFCKLPDNPEKLYPPVCAQCSPYWITLETDIVDFHKESRQQEYDAIAAKLSNKPPTPTAEPVLWCGLPLLARGEKIVDHIRMLASKNGADFAKEWYNNSNDANQLAMALASSKTAKKKAAAEAAAAAEVGSKRTAEHLSPIGETTAAEKEEPAKKKPRRKSP
ncbi:hypothetical protein A4X13_0g8757, partial [Tilletia indica]